jgi:hypothetical protein
MQRNQGVLSHEAILNGPETRYLLANGWVRANQMVGVGNVIHLHFCRQPFGILRTCSRKPHRGCRCHNHKRLVGIKPRLDYHQYIMDEWTTYMNGTSTHRVNASAPTSKGSLRYASDVSVFRMSEDSLSVRAVCFASTAWISKEPRVSRGDVRDLRVLAFVVCIPILRKKRKWHCCGV